MKALSALIVSLMCLILLACDDDEGRRTLPTPTPTPMPIPTPTPPPPCIPNEELVDSDCLAEDILNLCEPLECMAELIPGPFGDIPPENPVIFRLPTEEGCDLQEGICQGIRCMNNGLEWLLDFIINEDKNLEGTVIIDIDRFGGTFVCFIN